MGCLVVCYSVLLSFIFIFSRRKLINNMNWVGGSRSRLMLKNDVKRQKEFFEKKKLQKRLKNLGLPFANSSETCTSDSMDLVTMFIVNQIAAKKEKKDPPKVSVLGGGGGADSKQRQNEPLLLPMSPCAPSQLSLAESPANEISFTRKGRHVSKLSPVLESAFSDNSASDYAPHAMEALSPFSTSSASSAQSGGKCSRQLNQQQSSESQAEPATYSQACGGSRPEHDPFQAISLPRDMMDPKSCPVDLSQLETPSAAQVLFRSPSALDPSDNKVPVLDFSLNQQEYEEHFEEGFSSGQFMEASEKSKIHLRTDGLFQPLKPQMVPEMLYSELPSCSYTSSPCPGNSSAISDEGQYSPQCFTCDSSEDEEENCTQAGLTSTESNQRSLETLQQPPFPPFQFHQTKSKEEDLTCQKELVADNNQPSGSRSTSDFLLSSAQTQCQCWKKPMETCEAGTQTDSDKCEAAIQCSLLPAPVTSAPVFQPQVESAVQPLSSRGQTEHTDVRKRDVLILSPGSSGKETGQENWSKKMLKETRHKDKDLLSEKKYQPSADKEGKTSVDEAKGTEGSTEDAQTLQGIADSLLLVKQNTNMSNKDTH